MDNSPWSALQSSDGSEADDVSTAACDAAELTKSVAAAWNAVLQSPLQRHGMSWYKVRCSGMECRVTKSAAATWNVVVQQRSPLQRQLRSVAVLGSPMAALLPSFVPRETKDGLCGTMDSGLLCCIVRSSAAVHGSISCTGMCGIGYYAASCWVSRNVVPPQDPQLMELMKRSGTSLCSGSFPN
jgi:hypothetical protein